MLIHEPGTYSVELTDGMRVTKDIVNVVYYPNLTVDLGLNKFLCPGQSVTFDVTQYPPAEILWNDGGNAEKKTVSTPGTYWVQVKYVCEEVIDSVTLLPPAPIAFDLGEDKVICESQLEILDPGVPGLVSFEWQDGSRESQRTVTATGLYSVKVSNGCEVKEDAVRIVVLKEDDFIIPNIITPNDDTLNDFFVLPEKLQGSTLSIYNRWGENIFFSNDYRNTWKAVGQSSGVYFFTLQGECMAKSKKGTVSVVH
jgi:hypothetical protein